jgi:hypothetical protein
VADEEVETTAADQEGDAGQAAELAHHHEETRAAVEATGQTLHEAEGHADAHGQGHAGEHWGGGGDDPRPTYEPLGPIDWYAWGVAALSAAVALVTVVLFWVVTYLR